MPWEWVGGVGLPTRSSSRWQAPIHPRADSFEVSESCFVRCRWSELDLHLPSSLAFLPSDQLRAGQRPRPPRPTSRAWIVRRSGLYPSPAQPVGRFLPRPKHRNGENRCDGSLGVTVEGMLYPYGLRNLLLSMSSNVTRTSRMNLKRMRFKSFKCQECSDTSVFDLNVPGDNSMNMLLHMGVPLRGHALVKVLLLICFRLEQLCCPIIANFS